MGTAGSPGGREEACRECTGLEAADPAGCERATVPDAVDLVEDGNGGIPGAQEVGVQGVHGAVGVAGATRRHEGLTSHLPAEHPLTGLVGAASPEHVHLDRLE